METIHVGTILKPFIPPQDVTVDDIMSLTEKHHLEILHKLGVDRVTPEILRDISTWNKTIGDILYKAWIRDLLMVRGFSKVGIQSIVDGREDRRLYDALQDNTFSTLSRLGLQIAPSYRVSDFFYHNTDTLQERRINDVIDGLIFEKLPSLYNDGYALYDDNGIYAIDPMAAYAAIIPELEGEEYAFVYQAIIDNVIAQVKNNGFIIDNKDGEDIFINSPITSNGKVEKYYTRLGEIRLPGELGFVQGEQGIFPVIAFLAGWILSKVDERLLSK